MAETKNKIAILSFRGEEEIKNNFDFKRFEEEIIRAGYQPVILFHSLFSVFFRKNKLDFFYNNKKFNPAAYLFFISRYNLTKNNIYDIFSIARYLCLAGVKIFNPPQAAFLAKNKRDHLIQLALNNLPVVPSGINYSHFFLDQQLLKNKNNRIIVKSNSSSLGYSVVLLDSHISFISFIEFLGSNNFEPSNILIQPFVESDGEDYRLFVLGGKVIAAMKRKARGIEFRSNISKGGNGQKIKPDKNMTYLAHQATRLLGLDYAGVDIIKDKHGKAHILEVNSNPGLEIEKITGINIVEKIIAYCIKKSS